MNIAIMGYGVVGSGVAEVITKNADSILKGSNVSLSLKRILDLRDFENNPHQAIMTKSFDDILNDDSIDLVVETMGGITPAFDFVRSCLERGKHVVSSNKELVAVKGYELLECARKNNVNFLFEAAVGGGIPIIRPISRCLAGNNITEIAGILNGTSNFILTKMIEEGMSFADALSLAQQLGYAEKDPTADVEGLDAMRKICILASLAFGKHIYPDGVYAEGISKITLEDVAYADAAGYVIKLIARASLLGDGKVLAMVSPCLVSRDSMLSGVKGVFNACLVRGDMVGDVLMYGQGAGKLATASAVVGDIIDCGANSSRKFFGWEQGEEGMLADYNEAPTALYLRTSGATKQQIEAAFGGVTYLSRENQPAQELAFITSVEQEGTLRGKLGLSGIRAESLIRIAGY